MGRKVLSGRVVAGLLVVAAAAGCGAHGAVVQSELPVRRVVLYRNGVGYFERAGRTDEDEVRFRVRRRDVGDFLTSLAVVDRAGARVRSVSFESPEREEGGQLRPVPLVVHDGRLAALVAPPDPDRDEEDEGDEEDEPLEVVLRMERTGEHDLRVAYVVGTPLWRPTYRLVFGEGGEGLLQAWAVVQNRSGEDWTDVRLAVTTGAPIAFRSDLGTPIVPERPLVSDRGEVVAVVPRSHRTLPARRARRGGGRPVPSASIREAEEERAADEVGGLGIRGIGHGGGGAAGYGRGAPVASAAPRGYEPEEAASALAVAAEAEEAPGGITRYELTRPVTVPDGGSTMVALLSERVPGEVAHLYSPQGGVGDSQRHPFRVARFENRTGAMLERGPVTVFEEGEFVGQGVLEPLAAAAETFVPFAIDRAVVVERRVERDEEPGRLVAITRGRLVVEVFRVHETRYEVRNGRDRPIRLYVRHPRRPGMELVAPAEHRELTERAAVLPLRVEAGQEAELKVRERSRVRRTVSLISETGARAVALYLEGPAAEGPFGPVLREALQVRERLLRVQREASETERERADVERSAEQVRRNLEALRKVERAGQLRQRLVRRLSELDGRLAALTRRAVELREEERVLQVRLEELLRRVTLREGEADPS